MMECHLRNGYLVIPQMFLRLQSLLFWCCSFCFIREICFSPHPALLSPAKSLKCMGASLGLYRHMKMCQKLGEGLSTFLLPDGYSKSHLRDDQGPW